MTDTQPLTDERLAEIREWRDELGRGTAGLVGPYNALNDLLAEADRLRAVSAAAYAFAEEMADYCSPHGVAAQYAGRLAERLNDAGGQP